MSNWKPDPIKPGSEYEKLPSHLVSSIHRYVQEGQQPGDFLTGLLENDLRKAVSHADGENQVLLAVWTRYLYNRIPAPCHGSKEKVEQWLTKKRKE